MYEQDDRQKVICLKERERVKFEQFVLSCRIFSLSHTLSVVELKLPPRIVTLVVVVPTYKLEGETEENVGLTWPMCVCVNVSNSQREEKRCWMACE